MNEFKRPLGTTRWTRLQAENETLQQARDRALEAAAKWRQVAELALLQLLPSVDVSQFDAADLAAVQDFTGEATEHLQEMTEADPIRLIRLLLESMDSEELHYIRAAHEATAFRRKLEIEQWRLLAITEILKARKGFETVEKVRFISLATLNSEIGWMLQEFPYGPFSDHLQTKYKIRQAEINIEIFRLQKQC